MMTLRAHEVELVAALGQPIAEGIRLALTHGGTARTGRLRACSSSTSPGRAASGTSPRPCVALLDELDAAHLHVSKVAHQAHANGAARARARTRAGHWLALHAERYGDGHTHDVPAWRTGWPTTLTPSPHAMSRPAASPGRPRATAVRSPPPFSTPPSTTSS
jgi:hypothetical protein